MEMKKFLPFIMAILGVEAFSKNDEGKFSLTDEQRNMLAKEGYNATFISGFNDALEANFEVAATEEAPATEEEVEQGEEVVSGVDAEAIRVMTLTAAQQIEELNRLRGELALAGGENEQNKEQINNLKSQIMTLANQREYDDHPGVQGVSVGAASLNAADDKQLLGLQGEMFALENRPYNQRARAAILASQGVQVLVPVSLNPSVDFAKLEEDLGAYYRTQKRKELQSYIAQLDSVEKIFPLESGIQDREVLTNIFLGEFSQADSSDVSDFERVVKGKYEIQAEEIRMYDVMLAHSFKSLKKLEKQWIGEMNSNGSSSIKISFVEYLLRQTANKLHNERELRRIKGVRKNPVANIPGKALEASTGYFRYIHEKINNLQIKPFELGEITQANIGEKIYDGTRQIPSEWLDSGKVCLYMPSQMVVEYHKYNEFKFGVNQDYKPNSMFVKEYPDVKIIPVPHSGNHRRLVWTLEGNIKTFENEPGEMLNFRVLVKEWSLNVTTQWKEGFGAILVGKKWDRVQDMDFNHQLIWASNMDLPSTEYLPMGQDEATPSALFHNCLVSVANTASTAITDVLDVEVGGFVTLKCGADNYGITIAKSGKFADITAAWNPGVGDSITLVKKSGGNFIEVGRSSATSSVLAITANATSVSLDGGTEFMTNENTAATTIADFTGGNMGVVYTIYGKGSTNASEIAANNTTILVSAKMTFTTGTYLKVVKTSTGKYVEVARG